MKITINNKSTCNMETALELVSRSLNEEPVTYCFKDFRVDDDGFTVVIIKRKHSRTFNIYNENL